MTELKNWKNLTVFQRDTELGCIPAGFEWLIRYNGITGGFLDTFQEELNLQRKGLGVNTFETVSNAIMHKYPFIKIVNKSFEKGEEKIDFIEGLINKNIPCLMSLALTPQGGWHIMSVTGVDKDNLILKNGDSELRFTKPDVIYRHNNWPGGKDIAWIESIVVGRSE